MLTDQIRGIEAEVRQMLMEWGSRWDAEMRVRGVAELGDAVAALAPLISDEAAYEKAALAAYAVHVDHLTEGITGPSRWPEPGPATPEVQAATSAVEQLAARVLREHRTFTAPEARALLELGRINAHVGVVSARQVREQEIRNPGHDRMVVVSAARTEAVTQSMELAATVTPVTSASSEQIATALLEWDVAVGDALNRSASLATVQEIARTQPILYAAAHAFTEPDPSGRQRVPDAAWLGRTLRETHDAWREVAAVMSQMRYRDEVPFDRRVTGARPALTAALLPLVRDGAVPGGRAGVEVGVVLQQALAQAPVVAERIRQQVNEARWEAPGRAVHEASQQSVLRDPVHFPTSTIWVPVDAVISNGPRPLTTAATAHLDAMWTPWKPPPLGRPSAQRCWCRAPP